MNIYPAIDIKGGKCVRLRQGRFDAVTTYGDDPVEMALRWMVEGALRLHVVDLDGAQQGSPDPVNLRIVQRIIHETGLPVQFGGGIRNERAATRVRELGVARFVVGTAVAQDAALAQRLFAEHGDYIAVGVDARNGLVAIQGWQEHVGEMTAPFMSRMANLGARRFIFTDIGSDGMLQGVNIEALSQAAAAVPDLPVIASGGVTRLDDIDALNRLSMSVPNLEGVIIGKALYAGNLRLADVMKRAEPSLEPTNAYYLEQAR